jgi:hypothetical protein
MLLDLEIGPQNRRRDHQVGLDLYCNMRASLPIATRFPAPFPECQFYPLQNNVMDFAALLESGLPQGVV